MRVLGRAAAAVAASALVAALGLIDAPGASAARPGECTITGTPRADVLIGTPRSDVICGLGGDDRLVGRGGRDVLLGGSGRDVLAGGRGHDQLRGGSGHDRLLGGTGSDQLRGDSGDDVLRGGSREDYLYGGPGDDVLRGGSREDYLYGGPGDDDLEGGPERDSLDGGTGRDRCPPDAADLPTCYVDRIAPTVVSLTTSATRVDVTSAAKPVTVRVHLRDDLTVQGSWAPYLYLYNALVEGTYTGANDLRLVSGTVRDGVWATTITIPRGFPAASLNLEIHGRDRGGHMIDLRRQSFVEVVDERPDDEMPQVTVLSPASGSTLDTRRSGRITATARIADADTGVGPAPLFCLPRPPWPDLTYQQQSCTHATLVAGDRNAGTWQAVLHAPSKRGFISGPACLFVSATDAARPWSLEGRYTCRPIAQQFGWTITDGQAEPFTILGR